MTKRDEAHEKLMRDLATLKLSRIAEIYREVLDEAARKNSSTLEVFSTLIAEEAIARSERALGRRIRQARLPKRKTLEEYDFTFPKRMPKQKILRLFDCQFIEQHLCGIFIGPTGTGKSHLLTALGYTACEKGICVRYTRVVEMINLLTTAQINGTLEKALKAYVNPSLLLLDELGYLPIDKRGADLMFQVVAARYESGSIVLTTNRAFRDWGKIFDVDNTLATAMIDRLMHHARGVRNPWRQLSHERQRRPGVIPLTARLASTLSDAPNKGLGHLSRSIREPNPPLASLACRSCRR